MIYDGVFFGQKPDKMDEIPKISEVSEYLKEIFYSNPYVKFENIHQNDINRLNLTKELVDEILKFHRQALYNEIYINKNENYNKTLEEFTIEMENTDSTRNYKTLEDIPAIRGEERLAESYMEQYKPMWKILKDNNHRKKIINRYDNISREFKAQAEQNIKNIKKVFENKANIPKTDEEQKAAKEKLQREIDEVAAKQQTNREILAKAAKEKKDKAENQAKQEAAAKQAEAAKQAGKQAAAIAKEKAAKAEAAKQAAKQEAEKQEAAIAKEKAAKDKDDKENKIQEQKLLDLAKKIVDLYNINRTKYLSIRKQ
jgi:hypothetical protein